MRRRTAFIPYSPKRILNKGKRADHWFWTRYSAYPYLGCQHGCEFCYCRERKFLPYDDVDDFAHVIKVKQNAPQLLQRELRRVPVDAVFTGDYQPAERKFGVSRRMLEVCHDLGFPVFVLERSPLVLCDLDIIQAISQRAAAVVAFSIISTPDSPGYERVRHLEHLAPAADKRFRAMEQFARAGIVTGTCCMPILPGLTDDETTLLNIVRWTADHGGSFVIAGGLTLADQQRDYFFGVLRERFPDLTSLYDRLYPAGSYSPVGWRWQAIAQRLKALCGQYGIRDRIPRPIIPGEKRAFNKRMVEQLANEVYDMELTGEPASRVWALRKAAWAIEDLEQDVRLIYSRMGWQGLSGIEHIGPRLASKLQELVVALHPSGEAYRPGHRQDREQDGVTESENRKATQRRWDIG
jgi:DNA repair photolyase